MQHSRLITTNVLESHKDLYKPYELALAVKPVQDAILIMTILATTGQKITLYNLCVH